MKTCGEAVAHQLVMLGIDTVFGIPGVHTLELYRGIKAAGLQHVQPRHEQGAAFMADGYARVSGNPAACFLITGPGLTNAATGIAQAYSDSSPMLVVSSVNETTSLEKQWGRLHEIPNQLAISKSMTKFCATALAPADVSALLAQAHAETCSGRRRPVHIEIPIDVLQKPAVEAIQTVNHPANPEPCDDQIEQASTLIEQASHIVMLVGGGCVNASRLVTQLAERIGAVVVTTIAGKGIVASSHAQNAGACLYTDAGKRLVRDADLVIALATELGEPEFFAPAPLAMNGKLLRVDVDTRELMDDHTADLAILGSVESFCNKALTVLRAKTSDAANVVNTLHKEINSGLNPLQHKHKTVLDLMANNLPDNTFVAADMTQIAYTGNMQFACERPRSWLHPVGYGTLGFALPAAIGGKLAAPNRPAVALTGDGGFMFTVQELATAVELELPLAIVLWDNNAYGQIRDDMQASNIDLVGVRPQNPRFETLAQAFGCAFKRPQSAQDFVQALNASHSIKKPTLIQIQDDAVWL